MEMKDMFPMLAVDVHIHGEQMCRSVGRFLDGDEDGVTWDVVRCSDETTRWAVIYALVSTLASQLDNRSELAEVKKTLTSCFDQSYASRH